MSKVPAAISSRAARALHLRWARRIQAARARRPPLRRRRSPSISPCPQRPARRRSIRRPRSATRPLRRLRRLGSSTPPVSDPVCESEVLPALQATERGRGVAASLLATIAARVRDRGGSYVMGQSVQDPRVQRMYERLDVSFPGASCYVSGRAFRVLAELRGAARRQLRAAYRRRRGPRTVTRADRASRRSGDPSAPAGVATAKDWRLKLPDCASVFRPRCVICCADVGAWRDERRFEEPLDSLAPGSCARTASYWGQRRRA